MSAAREVAGDGGTSGPVPIETLVDVETSRDASWVQLRRGDTLGRFVVLDRLGAGGMGVVYAAYDPELDRRLAVKVLRGRHDEPEARLRLLREARAMARLSHPNVCVVHDVGTVAEQVYVAMEYVDGETLAQWLARERRNHAEILARFVAAGRGLAAAHTAGLVHRDFKPDNVMVANDGRVRVMDFGLARQAGIEPRDRPSGSEISAPELDALATPVTRAGSIAGTPAYMAPEQHLMLEVGGAADQFAFCVALYEALYGERPYAGRTLPELTLAVVHGQVRAAPVGSSVPTRLRRILLRGLEHDPAARWPTMDALLDGLERDPMARVRARALWAAGVTAIGVAGWAGWALRDHEPCAEAAARVEQVWNEDARDDARRAFAATGMGWAGDAWTRVEARVDEHAAGWVAMREDACEATHVRHEQSSELLDLRMACLDRRLAELDALVDVLAGADAAVVENAATAVDRLRPLDRCADTEALRAGIAPPTDSDAQNAVSDLRTRIDRAAALRFAGRVDEALALARGAHDDVASVHYEPVTAEVQLALGSTLDSVGDYPSAEVQLREALWSALAIGHDDVAVEAATELVHVVGYQLSRHDEALVWARQADALVRRTGSAWDREAELLGAMGSVFEDAARFDDAREHHERALAIREREAAGTLDLARTVNNLGGVLQSLGDFEESRRHHARALELAERVLGPKHPQLRPILNGLGIVLDDLGDYEGALAAYRRALAVSESSLGPAHPAIAGLLTNIGVSLLNVDRYEEALGFHERALVAWEKSVGPTHAHVASTLNNMAAAYVRLDRYEPARDHLERALAVWTSICGPDHPNLADALINFAGVLIQMGETGEARTQLERAIRIYERAKGREHPGLAFPLSQLATVETREGHRARAVALLERALPLAERNGPTNEARVRFDLARALVAAGSDHETARAHAERALTLWLAAGESSRSRAAEVEAWLR